MARKTHDVLSVDWIRLELLRTAYSTRGGLFSRMDPRIVIAWYLVLAIAPWLTHDTGVLLMLFALGVASVVLARVGPLVLGLFLFGLLGNVIGLFAASFLFGGDLGTLAALGELNLKLGAVSMASMAAFVSLDRRSSPTRCCGSVLRSCSPSGSATDTGCFRSWSTST